VWGFGFRSEGLGLRVYGLQFTVYGEGLMVEVYDFTV
jgi:hypothetical protein